MAEFGKTMRKFKPGKRNSKERYNNDTKVAKWLDHQAEGLHKKLKLNKHKQMKDSMLKNAQLDKLQESGIVKTVISKRQRRKEIDKNNVKLLDALQESNTIIFQDKKLPRSRSSRSNAIILA